MIADWLEDYIIRSEARCERMTLLDEIHIDMLISDKEVPVYDMDEDRFDPDISNWSNEYGNHEISVSQP